MFALRAFAPGEFVFRRRHVPISVAAIARLPLDEGVHVCQTDVARFAIVAPPGCYVNHSCDPNALRRGVHVVAWKVISAGNEVTLDYRLNAVGGSPWECLCGSASCSGLVDGGFFGLDRHRQRELLPFAGDFVRREYLRRVTAHG